MRPTIKTHARTVTTDAQRQSPATDAMRCCAKAAGPATTGITTLAHTTANPL